MMYLENSQDLDQERKCRFHLDPHHPINLFKRKGESMDHVSLKVLAYAIYWLSHDLQFDARLQAKFQPDLVALDFTGEPELWIECGEPDPERIEFALKHTNAPEVVLVTHAPDIEPVVEELRRKIHFRYTRGRLKVIAFTISPAEFCLDPVEIPLGSYEVYNF